MIGLLLIWVFVGPVIGALVGYCVLRKNPKIKLALDNAVDKISFLLCL